MDIIQFKKKLDRYLKGTATETENAVVEAWYKSYRADEARDISESDKDAVKNTIHQRIKTGIKPPAKIRRIRFLSAAASLMLISGAVLLYHRYQTSTVTETYTTLQTKAGEVKQVLLPDSSVMWVNSLSRVRIPSAFNGTIRNVLLDEGEAFFEVKHNAAMPFRVSTGALRVQVLGTSFNINAYKKLNRTRVAVATGKVAVSAGGKVLSMLTPGRELVFNTPAKTYTQHQIDISQSRSWRDGDTYLNQVGFDELALIVKNLYGVELKPATAAIAAYQFTLRLQRQMPANDAFKVISLIHNNQFRKEGDRVILY